MKHLILWGSLVGVSILVFALWEKTTTLTVFTGKNAPVIYDAIFLLIGLGLVIDRGIAIYQKLFR